MDTGANTAECTLDLPIPRSLVGGKVRAEVAHEGLGIHRVARHPIWVALGTAAVLFYALSVLIAAWMSAELGFIQLQGSRVVSVEAGGPAFEAGLRAGDVIIAINGHETLDNYLRATTLRRIMAGDPVQLVVKRGSSTIVVSFVAAKHLPMGSAAGIVFGTLLLAIALLAGRGPHPRSFFRSTLVYVVLLAGTFSLRTVLGHPALAVPWLFSCCFAGPATCHFMMKFPAGPLTLPLNRVLWIYIPPLLLGTIMATNHVAFLTGYGVVGHASISLGCGVAAGLMAALYLTIGCASRTIRIRKNRSEIDDVAARWLQLGAASVSIPLLAGGVWAVVDGPAFVSGGFRPMIAVAMIGGSSSVVLAMARVRFGDLDRMWRQSSGYVLATGMAAMLYLALIGLLGSTASAMSGGDFRTALGATLAAAIVFGPLRVRVQQVVDERFARDRGRARRLLREAYDAAAATLEIDVLQNGIVHRVRSALAAQGVGIYVGDSAADGGWRRVAEAGELPLAPALAAADPISAKLDAALTARSRRELGNDVLAIPLPVMGAPAALVVAPREERQFDDEERDLLSTVGAGLVIAIGNARAHSELQELTLALHREVEIAEGRRREIARLKERVEAENRELIGTLAARTGKAPVIGCGLKPTFELVQKVARTQSSVLVRGETGVGKELVARAIHAGSPRRDGPFIVVDCGAMSPNLFESTLFGHVRGAFTGAVRDARGAFRAANGGTIFLDEIGELPADLQPKLLRVLQEREVHPVGSETSEKVDVRVIAGTNRDLSAEAETGGFRQDLLYRLQVVEVEVPPLRQRRGDIEALAEHFLAVGATRSGRLQKRLAPDAMQALLEHDWPGNVRELENALEAAAVYAEGEEIGAADLPIYEKVFRKKGKRAISESGIRVNAGGAPRSGLRETLGDLERQRLVEALEENNGNKTRTAKALGMSRGSLLRRLKRYEIGALA